MYNAYIWSTSFTMLSVHDVSEKHMNIQGNRVYLAFFMFEFPCIISLYYIKYQHDATLAVF